MSVFASGDITADGDTDIDVSSLRRHQNPDRIWLHLLALGTYGGGTLTIQAVDSEGTAITLTDRAGSLTQAMTMSASAERIFRSKVDTIRLSVTGASTPDIHWELYV